MKDYILSSIELNFDLTTSTENFEDLFKLSKFSKKTLNESMILTNDSKFSTTTTTA